MWISSGRRRWVSSRAPGCWRGIALPVAGRPLPLARIAVDLIGAMFLLYYPLIGRGEDFSPTSSPFSRSWYRAPGWLQPRHSDKRTVFVAGTPWA
jgi:hypothetical protein